MNISPNYLADSAEAKLVEIIPASEKIQKRFNDKISPDMKEAISTICSQVFNKCQYPYALIGSNCYIPHTEHSEKIPDDLDVVFGIQDRDNVYVELQKMAADNQIKDLSMEELQKFGKEKNGCFKIHCLIKTENGYKEMEAFAQNMNSEVMDNENKINDTKLNGIINLGAEKQTIEVVLVNGAKVNIGSEKTAEELYLKNTANEFALYNLNGWDHKGSLNPKALQRIFNLINLDGQKFEDSIDLMIKNITRYKPVTDEARVAQESLQHLWAKFKTLEVNHRNGEKKEGLVNHLIKVNGIKFDTTDDRENKILSTEKAVDIITQKTKEDMVLMSTNFEEYKKLLENKGSAPAELITNIDNQILSLSTISKEYKKYLSLVNKDDKNDFCVYAAIPQLRDHFILPILTKLNRDRMKLEKNKK
ncbi:hypothetical protein COT98_01935 [Candidatus Falkowbacteria bacterium CG10_big_fil_rev_8_21_14_0_10_39_9]|uniref:Uncharacterized protein n=1 Tax=Candidatus Falkowbacteria bacterium CG10_big_fil_rev_8_21_14_0_10_39_9 TaxID=1974566 RepID=A0A2M6WPY7_9BACT|nr:MAG: hypothetical protein COT98_01935 [Candidatus Falkowbacteria bacterium CG10_big_fil_rev_8_21_14_0_10_39_9]